MVVLKEDAQEKRLGKVRKKRRWGERGRRWDKQEGRREERKHE